MSELNTTKMHTLEEVVEAYKALKAEEAKAEAERKDKLAKELLEMLLSYGLQPLRIEDGDEAVFEYEGQEIKFRIWLHNGWNIERINTCPDCGEEIQSYEEWNISVQSFGKLLLDPIWKRHNCQADADQTETAEQRFISALRELLHRE